MHVSSSPGCSEQEKDREKQSSRRVRACMLARSTATPLIRWARCLHRVPAYSTAPRLAQQWCRGVAGPSFTSRVCVHAPPPLVPHRDPISTSGVSHCRCCNGRQASDRSGVESRGRRCYCRFRALVGTSAECVLGSRRNTAFETGGRLERINMAKQLDIGAREQEQANQWL